jgi:isocitrate dehydrogenase
MTPEKIKLANGKLNVPDNPVIPFIEGDGTGPDIWKASVRVFDAAVNKVYKGKRKVEWKEVLAGEKAFKLTGSWLPDETLTVFRDYLDKGAADHTCRGGNALTECGTASAP